jgi:uncharacterized protein DUF1877
MLGVHFALPVAREQALLAAVDDGDAVGEFLEELEESWDDPTMQCDTDKAWDAIHRCLTDGTLHPEGGGYPLSHAVLGGRHLHEEYYVVYLTAREVQDVAEALRPLDRASLRRRFAGLSTTDYTGSGDEEDFDYTWTNFLDLRGFYGRAAAAGRAVLFTAT